MSFTYTFVEKSKTASGRERIFSFRARMTGGMPAPWSVTKYLAQPDIAAHGVGESNIVGFDTLRKRGESGR